MVGILYDSVNLIIYKRPNKTPAPCRQINLSALKWSTTEKRGTASAKMQKSFTTSTTSKVLLKELKGLIQNPLEGFHVRSIAQIQSTYYSRWWNTMKNVSMNGRSEFLDLRKQFMKVDSSQLKLYCHFKVLDHHFDFRDFQRTTHIVHLKSDLLLLCFIQMSMLMELWDFRSISILSFLGVHFYPS